ncbi:hypothetical protein PIROE2DRAFT_16026 [Piromyces sp. E2]|nr:hypothetical protein PIROE2DRAFT_16026 [Piromyces sp. E2]|eukprot:OUM58646.1 hypothetical protein PIROE2DRAFT_16026 [Piromyces sp. E2]
MSLYFYSNPLENSLFDVFDNDLFENNHHYNFDSLIPYSTFNHQYCHPCRSSVSRRIRKNNRWSLYKKLEKQLKKYFKEENKKLVDFIPKINLTDDENNYYIHADLPGMSKDQVKMEIDNEDRILTISGERKSFYKNNNNESDNENEEKAEKKEKEEKEENQTISNNESENKSEKETKNETKEAKETKESNEKETKLTNPSEKSKEIQEKNNCHYSVMECSYGTFSRSFVIPEDANLDNIQAKMENGVLEVTINKVKKESKNKNRSIQIQ